MPGAQGPRTHPPGAQGPGGTPHPRGGVKGFLAERQNDGFWRFDPLFFPFLALSSFPAPPSRLPHPLLASDTLRVPPPLFFLLVSHPTRGREEFSDRKSLQWQSSLTLVLWRNHHSTPHREGRRCVTKWVGLWFSGEMSIVFPRGRAAGATPNGARPWFSEEITIGLPIGRAAGAAPNGRVALVIWRLPIGRASEFRAAGAIFLRSE